MQIWFLRFRDSNVGNFRVSINAGFGNLKLGNCQKYQNLEIWIIAILWFPWRCVNKKETGQTLCWTYIPPFIFFFKCHCILLSSFIANFYSNIGTTILNKGRIRKQHNKGNIKILFVKEYSDTTLFLNTNSGNIRLLSSHIGRNVRQRLTFHVFPNFETSYNIILPLWYRWMHIKYQYST